MLIMNNMLMYTTMNSILSPFDEFELKFLINPDTDEFPPCPPTLKRNDAVIFDSSIITQNTKDEMKKIEEYIYETSSDTIKESHNFVTTCLKEFDQAINSTNLLEIENYRKNTVNSIKQHKDTIEKFQQMGNLYDKIRSDYSNLELSIMLMYLVPKLEPEHLKQFAEFVLEYKNQTYDKEKEFILKVQTRYDNIMERLLKS